MTIAWSSLVQRFKQWRCDHTWWPCITKDGGGMHCWECEKTIDLSDGEFYARFGKTWKEKYAIQVRLGL